ncbi:MAG: hypothetical protein J6A63_03445 [Clostridia bacterium]|nr:hypothetical protein [Clostridia bacterium]
MSKKLGITKVALSALCGLCVAAGALALTPATAAAETTYTSVGTKYFHTYDGTVESFTDKPSTNWGTGYIGVRTELTVPEGTTEAKVSYNGTIDPAMKQIVAFDNATKNVQEAKAIVVTYKSVQDPTKMVSLICTDDGNYGRYTLAFSDEFEFNYDSDDYFAYYAGTNMQSAVMGLNPNYNGTTQPKKYFGFGFPSTSRLLSQGDTQMYLDASGNMKLNDSTIVGNILDPEFLSASAASLGNHELASRYTEEYAQSVLSALMDSNSSDSTFDSKAIWSISYYGLKTTKVAFLFRQIQGLWLKADANGQYVHSYRGERAYVEQKVKDIYVGESYRFVGDLVDFWHVSSSTDQNFDGYYNTDSTGTGGTWFRWRPSTSQNLTVNVSTLGKYYIYGAAQNDVTAKPWNIYGKSQLLEFNVIAKPQIDFKVGENSLSGYPVSAMNGDKVTMPTAENTATEVFVGWANGTKLYKAGTQITVDGDATYTAKYLAFTTEDKASLRIAENGNGVRFTSKFNKVQAQEFLAMDNFAYSFGTKITSNNSTQSLDVEGNKDLIYENGDNYCFNAAIVNVKDINLTRVYHAKAYMTVTYSDGATATIEAIQEGNEGRSYAQILAAAKADETIGGLLKAAVAAEYERVFASKTLVPSITITVDGADVDEMTFATELNAYFANKTWKIGDTVDLSDITFAGYTVGGTLTGVMTERGLNITIALTTAA